VQISKLRAGLGIVAVLTMPMLLGRAYARTETGDPQPVSVALRQAQLLIQAKKYAAANEILAPLAIAEPPSVAVLTVYANLCDKLDDTQKAETLLVRCTRLMPGSIGSWKLLGDFYLRHGSNKALECFQRASQLQRDDPQSWAGMGAASSQAGDSMSAAGEFERAIQLNELTKKPNPMIDLLYADFLRESQQYSRSIAEYGRAIDRDGSLFEARLGRARSLIRQNQLSAAEQDLDVCAKQPEMRLEALNLLLVIYRARGDKRTQECTAEIRKLSDDEMQRKVAGNQIASELTKARELVMERKYSEAQGAYQSVVKAHPEVPQAYQGVAECAFETGNLQLAERAMRQSLGVEETASAHVFLGRILLRENRLDDARQEFSRAKSIDTIAVEAWLGLAACEMVQAKYRAAQEILREASALPTVSPDVHLMLTEALYKNHEPSAAIREIDQLLAKDPDNSSARQMKAQLVQQKK
jgi:tetratricopeptide (TPR) repeat protein